VAVTDVLADALANPGSREQSMIASGPNYHGTLVPQPTVQSTQVQKSVVSAPKDQETVCLHPWLEALSARFLALATRRRDPVCSLEST
jgi:hypothetical protein